MQRSIRNTLSQAALIGFVAASATLSPSPATAAEAPSIHRAERALATGHPAVALEALEDNARRLNSNADLAEAAGLRCQAHLALGQPTLAISACEQATALDQGLDSWRYWNNLGAAHLYLDEYDAARGAFEKAVRISGWRQQNAPMQNLRLVRRILAAQPDPTAVAASTTP